jgi:hypothetical protein
MFITSCKKFCTNLASTNEEYLFLCKDFKDYIYYFGPLKDIFRTPYFHFSLVMAIITGIFACEPNIWAEHALSMLPDILGFSIGGYAIIITFGDNGFRKFLVKAKTGDGKSILMVINGAFIHFIMTQTLSIVLAYFVNSIGINNLFFNILLSLPFFYSLIFCIAIAFEIKTISQWYKKFIDSQSETTTNIDD